MPNGVAPILCPLIYPLSYNVSRIVALVDFVPKFLFSSSEIIEAGEYLFGGCVSFCSVLTAIILTSPSKSGIPTSFNLVG